MFAEPADWTGCLRANLRAVQEEIAAACRRAGRRPGDVRLVAVTKYVPVPVIRALVALGVTDIGESRVQTLVARAAQLGSPAAPPAGPDAPPPPRWHLVGHLQRNKVRAVLPHVALIHSVDSLRLAAEIERQAARLGRRVPVLLEVNVSGEPSKFGLEPQEVPRVAAQVAGLPHVGLCGLMTMAPWVEPEQTRPVFAALRELRDRLLRDGHVGPQCRELSMGMSNDFAVAVEEGATIVRVGTRLFAGLPPELRTGPVPPAPASPGPAGPPACPGAGPDV